MTPATASMMLPYPSSSSSTTVSQCYDVFMSFRGEDTRMTFTNHLYDALIQNGIITYKDDRTLELGKPIALELIQAIEASKIAVVILSRQYATSKWCLQEIAEIVDCMKLGKLIVIPIFYHVTPSDVRHQSNCFEQAFSNHDANTQIAPGTVNMWRAAFKEVGALAGLHVTKDKDEAEVVRRVVSQVLSYLSNTMPLDRRIERSGSAATAVYAVSSAAATYGERSAAIYAPSSAAPQWPYTLHQAQPQRAASAATTYGERSAAIYAPLTAAPQWPYTLHQAQPQRAASAATTPYLAQSRSQPQHRSSERSRSTTSSVAASSSVTAVSSAVGASAATAVYAVSRAAATCSKHNAATAVYAASSAAPQQPTLHRAQPPHAVSAATTPYRAQLQRAPQGSQPQHRCNERSRGATPSAAAVAAVSSAVGASAAAAVINEVNMDELLYSWENWETFDG